MRLHESPNIPFTVLYSKGKILSCIQFARSHACNLHLNREPVHFKDSWFLVDRFHWYNHTCESVLLDRAKLYNSQPAVQDTR